MRKLADFNLAKIKHQPVTKANAEQTNKATCSVVINNMPKFQESMTIGDPPVVEREVTIEETPSSNDLELYKTLSLTLANILKTNNIKLLANLIDTSGKVILDAISLVKLIGLITDTPQEQVSIEYQTKEDVGCLSKNNPVKIIETIKVNHQDFKLCFNQQYNILSDTYSISLRKMIIPSGVTLD